ncbi:M4 family metallopeptidase [Actinoplanes sp. TRM 88003]|uniref:M4 family metallopeptidase n=1 Tax=Paractinoplanes aksuensis TaxID=2939490 RepID=A0ABT1DRW0_9ACTN|nr:M4 family metallopeptidase [Actinoplanes aksuensis]MCO8273555.1 M4 family metallopeptidase [Actinoplanes aksuensis]
MTVRRSHARGLLAGAAAAVLIGGGFVAFGSAPSTPAASFVSPVAAPAAPGRSTSPASRPEVVTAARTTVTRDTKAIHGRTGEKYQARDVVVDPDGDRHVRFDRTWNGLPVLGGDFVVHTDQAGARTGTTVAQQAPIEVSRTPKVKRAKAVTVAQKQFTGRRGGPATARLVVDAYAGKPALAWEATVPGTARSGLPSRLVVVVDATTGQVRRSHDQVHTADEGTGRGLHTGSVELATKHTDAGYELTDTSRGGNTTRDAQNLATLPTVANSKAFTDADNAWGDGTVADRASAGVDVHYGMARTWDWFQSEFGRAGIGGDGKGITAYAHYDLNEANAGWSDYCRCMFFGDGAPPFKAFTSLDIVAHEMAHGFTTQTADLVYAGESGGLNEATSDIIGTLVEFAAANPADEPDYLVGEKIDAQPLRYMDEPNRDGKSASCWSPLVPRLDVHYSSGIANKFFYNLAVGSGTTRWGTSTPCGTAAPVTGIGNEAAGAIWYRAVSAYMVSNTNFVGARQATLRAAADLFGATSPQHDAVAAAWLAVGVDRGVVPPAPTAPVIDRPEPADGMVGRPVELQMTGRDPQRQQLTWTAPEPPPGLTISPSGLISGVPTVKDLYYFDVIATDPDGNSTTLRVLWYIKGPPVILGPAPAARTFTTGAAVSFSVSFSDGSDYSRDPGRPLVVRATGLPAGLTVTDTPLESSSIVRAMVSGTPTTAGAGTMTITATDADGGVVTATIPWTVSTTTLPTEPVGVSVTAGNGSAVVKWDDPFPADSAAVTGYVVRVTPGTTQTLPATARSVTLTGLSTKQSYTVGVTARGTQGDSPEKVSKLVPTQLLLSPISVITGYGGPVTMNGVISTEESGPIAGAVAYLEKKPTGSTTWTRVVTVKTDSTGSWRHPVQPTVTTAYRVTFPAGSYGRWPATSAASAVTVRYGLTVKVSAASTTANKPVTFSGTVKPATPGVKVALQRNTNGTWATIQTVAMKADGTYSIARAFPKGTWNLRILASGGGTNGYGFTSTLKVTAK